MGEFESIETVEIWIDQQVFKVMHATNAEQRRQGLAGRVSLEADGMLFSYEYPVYRPFYMRRTFLPLVIAFFDHDGEFLGSRTMKPLCEDPVLPPAPFQYAIEFVKGREPKTMLKLQALSPSI